MSRHHPPAASIDDESWNAATLDWNRRMAETLSIEGEGNRDPLSELFSAAQDAKRPIVPSDVNAGGPSSPTSSASASRGARQAPARLCGTTFASSVTGRKRSVATPRRLVRTRHAVTHREKNRAPKMAEHLETILEQTRLRAARR